MRARNIRLIRLFIMVATMVTSGIVLSSCSGLSDRARQMTGNYYIPEISEDDPLMELRPDGSCTLRAIKPALLTYSVDGKWNVIGDSLVADLDSTTLKWEGDRSLIGNITSHFSRHIVSFSEISLTVDKDGVQYIYHRRNN